MKRTTKALVGLSKARTKKFGHSKVTTSGRHSRLVSAKGLKSLRKKHGGRKLSNTILKKLKKLPATRRKGPFLPSGISGF